MENFIFMYSLYMKRVKASEFNIFLSYNLSKFSEEIF